MSKSKRIGMIILLCILSFSLATGCTAVASTAATTTQVSTQATTKSSTTQPTNAQQETIVLKLGIGAPPTNPVAITANEFAADLYEASNKRIKIEVFPSEILGTDKQMAEACAMNTLDMSINAHGTMAAYEPKLALIELPFLFSDTSKVGALLDGPVGDELAASLPAKGVRILAYWENGLRQIGNSKREINTPADLKGIKIRTPENAMTIKIFEALGASPSPFAFGELYLALQQGMFDAQENAIINMNAAKFHEVQKYISITNHKYETRPFIVSEKVWQKIPADLQTLVLEKAKEYAQVHRDKVAKEDMALLAVFEKDYKLKVTRPDLTPFREATKSIYEEFETKFGKELVDKIRNAVK